jgi:hypothetical protein
VGAELSTNRPENHFPTEAERARRTKKSSSPWPPCLCERFSYAAYRKHPAESPPGGVSGAELSTNRPENHFPTEAERARRTKKSSSPWPPCLCERFFYAAYRKHPAESPPGGVSGAELSTIRPENHFLTEAQRARRTKKSSSPWPPCLCERFLCGLPRAHGGIAAGRRERGGAIHEPARKPLSHRGTENTENQEIFFSVAPVPL